MKQKNQLSYPVLFARFTQDYRMGVLFPKGSEYPVNTEGSQCKTGEVEIVQHSRYYNDIYPVAESAVETFEKTITPQFKLGDIVAPKGQEFAFRVFEYEMNHGRIWYHNTWCMITGLANGSHEEDLELASEEQKQKYLQGGDDHKVVEKYPELAYLVQR